MTITEVKYYYYRDQHRAPRVTVCRVRDDLGRYGYGWSICTDPSPHPGDRIQDDTLIRGGRSIARGRAEAALLFKRGIPCRVRPDGIINRAYHRRIRRPEGLRVIHACRAGSLLQFLDERDVRWLPDPIRPKSVAYDLERLDAPAQQRLRAIRAGGDANELARLEMPGMVDAAGYLAGVDVNELARRQALQQLDTLQEAEARKVYSEALERFVPESEAL